MSSHEPRSIVLVVDDSPDTLRMLTDAIEDAGMTVLVALDGEQALSLTERITPDIILMDALMPGMDGFEICRRLKRNSGLSHVPVIFMTGLGETEDIVKGLDAGGVDYLRKPISPDEMLARIKVHLANARISQSARTALDASGRFLLASNRAGRILWSTPQATRLLGTIFSDFHSKAYVLPADMQAWLRLSLAHKSPTQSKPFEIKSPGSPLKFEMSVISQTGPEEVLLRLVESSTNSDKDILRSKLQLTQREAEVLLWIAQGKSNRDIAEILSLSPRTVNKHLEQIFNKIGVENRTSAAALAVRLLNGR